MLSNFCIGPKPARVITMEEAHPLSTGWRLGEVTQESRALPLLPLDWPPKKTPPKTNIFQLWYQVQVVQDHQGSPHDHSSSTIFFKKNFLSQFSGRYHGITQPFVLLFLMWTYQMKANELENEVMRSNSLRSVCIGLYLRSNLIITKNTVVITKKV